MLIISTPNLSRCRGSWHHRENPVATTPGPYTHGEGTTQTHTNEDKKSSTLLRGAHKCGERHRAARTALRCERACSSACDTARLVAVTLRRCCSTQSAAELRRNDGMSIPYEYLLAAAPHDAQT